jgi:hypothetical protein
MIEIILRRHLDEDQVRISHVPACSCFMLGGCVQKPL